MVISITSLLRDTSKMKNKKITKLISQSESNLKDIADQMSEEFAKMQENSAKREIADFNRYKGVYEEVSEDIEPEEVKEPDLIDYAVQNIMKGVFK